jgi:hypothetical protein
MRRGAISAASGAPGGVSPGLSPRRGHVAARHRAGKKNRPP